MYGVCASSGVRSMDALINVIPHRHEQTPRALRAAAPAFRLPLQAREVEAFDCQSGGASGPASSDAWTYDRDPPIFGKDRASSLTIISNPSCILATHLRKMTAYSFSSLPDHI